MSPNSNAFVFRALVRLYVFVTALTLFFLTLTVLTAIKKGDWWPVVYPPLFASPLYALLMWLRLDVDADGFSYRGPLGTRRVVYTDVTRAYFETIRSGNAPQGVTHFYVQLRSGENVSIKLRCFPIRAAAWILTALERHQVPIDVPETWSARNMHGQILAEQKKLAESLKQA
jgi:hypothetical protein